MIQREPVIPGHYRLSDESWAEITEAFKNGATARELAVKWRVSMGSVYGHARKAGVGKKITGNERAVEHARAVEAREATRGPVEWETQRQQTAALFSAVTPEESEVLDPADAAELARQATLASGRAMRKGMWGESKALASLAESYARLADRKKASELTLDNIPLALVAAIAEGPERAWRPRMSLADVRDDDPDNDTRRWFWERHRARKFSWERQMSEKYAEGMERGRQIEAQAAGD